MSGTFWIALSGLVLSVASLAWQFITWSYSGARVRVGVNESLMIAVGQGEKPKEVIDITARNRGRASVEVTFWGLSGPGNLQLIMPLNDGTFGPSVPTELQGLHRLSWSMGVEGIVTGLEERGFATGSKVPFNGFVSLATGRTIKSKDAVEIEIPNGAR